ncbi:MAG: TolC family protein [Muribaculaceae bacterium]|nr:TolC family protein [Muribaculaceae bacterium]MDE5595133.1 TolC family protein [Muribaculaceae bacterium]MDE6703493.1 TolC family protein [Muribaculaceae bacterium]
MRLQSILAVVTLSLSAAAQVPSGVVSLDSCRSMALESNKQLMITRQAMKTAHYQNREAFAAYLPALDFNGGYMYNQKDISIFSKDQYLPIKTFDMQKGSYEFSLVTNPETGMPIKGPDGQYIPKDVAYLPKDAMTYDIHNVFFGAVTLTQPIYMGGKIVAMNKITRYAEHLAEQLNNSEAENVVYAVDAAYWMVVSLKSKQKLAQSYVNLLDTLQHNVKLMVDEGVATRSDLLSVDVKLNSAQVDLTKVDNGLSLARMALAQVCGLPVNTVFTLADEDLERADVTGDVANQYNMEEVYSRRPDLRALEIGVNIAGQAKNVALSDMLPKVAVIGAYGFSNPNMFNGFAKRFNGAFSVGATVSIPIWHWGGNYNKYRAAKSEETIMKLRLSDARDLVDLQVNQASFKAQEAYKTYDMTSTNLAKADDNLRTANLAFKEGVATTDNVMEAQTAWLKAHSEQIDAMIDVYLCNTYLSKALGTLQYEYQQPK